MRAKNLSFLLAAFGISISAVAQPTLTQSNHAPVIGDSIQYITATNFSGNEGPAGANQTWDFSIVGSGAVRNLNYISCSESPGCANNPGANVVLKENTGAYTYYIVENNKMSIKGIEGQSQGQNVAFLYDDPEEIMHFPFTYNNTYSDNTHCTASMGSGVELVRSGTTTVTADAYGTLKTPMGTFPNTLRIFTKQVYEDLITVGGNYPQANNYVVKIYTWYQPDIRNMLFSISEISVNGEAPMVTALYSNAAEGTAIKNVANAKPSFNIFPNPASNYANIKLTENNDAIQSIHIINVLGQRLAINMDSALGQSQDSYTLDLRTIPSGNYWVRVQTKKGQFSQKLQIMK